MNANSVRVLTEFKVPLLAGLWGKVPFSRLRNVVIDSEKKQVQLGDYRPSESLGSQGVCQNYGPGNRVFAVVSDAGELAFIGEGVRVRLLPQDSNIRFNVSSYFFLRRFRCLVGEHSLLDFVYLRPLLSEILVDSLMDDQVDLLKFLADQQTQGFSGLSRICGSTT